MLLLLYIADLVVANVADVAAVAASVVADIVVANVVTVANLVVANFDNADLVVKVGETETKYGHVQLQKMVIDLNKSSIDKMTREADSEALRNRLNDPKRFAKEKAEIERYEQKIQQLPKEIEKIEEKEKIKIEKNQLL